MMRGISTAVLISSYSYTTQLHNYVAADPTYKSAIVKARIISAVTKITSHNHH